MKGDMGERASGTTQRIATGAASILFWILAWQSASMAVNSEFILAGPLDAARSLVRLIPEPEFWVHIGFSLARIALGTAAGYVLAIALAAAAHAWRAARILIAPALSAIKSTPVACVVVVLLIWFGSRNVSAIAVFLMVLPGVYFPVLKGLDQLDPAREELFWLYRAHWGVRLLAHVVPGVLPYLVSASATVLSMSWKAGVAAELIGVPDGSIGERIYQAKLLLETADLFAWTIVVVLIAWAFEHLVLAALKACWPAAGRWAARRGEAAVTAPSTADARELVGAHNLAIGHTGTVICRGLDVSLHRGETLCLQGPSGAGKTTFIATISGAIPPLSGELNLLEHMRMSAVFQDTRLIDDLNACDNVRMFSGAATPVRELLAELLPTDALDVPVRELSGGQRRRVELVRALAAPSDLVLLDEPFTGLDEDTHRRAIAFIRAHANGRAIVLSTHDPRDAEALGAHVLTVGRSRVGA